MPDRSPFPGMDPWLESYWGDVHHRVIENLRNQINGQLLSDLFVLVEENVYLIEAEDAARLVRPDLGAFDFESQAGGTRESASAAIAVAEPIRIMIPLDPITEGHIEIRELRDGHPLVTAIEVLSPTNKRDARARTEYLEKRRSFIDAKANVMELDFLRGGRDLIEVPLGDVDPRMQAAYKCCVRRGEPWPPREIEFYPLPLRQRLPGVRLPLRPSEDDIVVDLQRPIDDAYAAGRYDRRIDYSRTPEPPLSVEDAAWAAELVATASNHSS